MIMNNPNIDAKNLVPRQRRQKLDRIQIDLLFMQEDTVKL